MKSLHSFPVVLLSCLLGFLLLAFPLPVRGQFDFPLSTLIFLNNQNSTYDSTTNSIKITLPQLSYTQFAYYPSYLRLVNDTYWSVHITYTFSGGGDTTGVSYGADGFAFVMHNLGFGAIGALGNNLGVPEGAFGVGLQTYSNQRIAIHLPNGTITYSPAPVTELVVPLSTTVGPYNVTIEYNQPTVTVTIDSYVHSVDIGPLDPSLLGNDVVVGWTGGTGGAYELAVLTQWRCVSFATLELVPHTYNTTVGTILTVSSSSEGLLRGSSQFGVGSLSFNGSCAGGSISILSDGTFTYTPPSQFYGADACNVSATDGETKSNQVTVTFNVALTPNRPPVVTIPSALSGTVSVYSSNNYTLYLSGINITDPDAGNGYLSLTVTPSTNDASTTYNNSQTALTSLFHTGKGLQVNFQPVGSAKTGTVGIYVNDEGNFGTGGPQSTSATISVEFVTSSSSLICCAWLHLLHLLVL